MEPTKVMVVDDDAFIRRPLEFILREEGFEPSIAIDGDDCLARVREVQPDVIILDVMMPGLSGFDVCKTLKADPQLANIPVILLSAKGQDADRMRGIDAGAQDYVTKPYVPSDLLSKVRRLTSEN